VNRQRKAFNALNGECGKSALLESISSTFYAHILRTKVLCEAFFYLHVTREKLPKKLLYKKGTHKMLMKLTPGADPIKLFFFNNKEFLLFSLLS
jgi:hypothetical protein